MNNKEGDLRQIMLLALKEQGEMFQMSLARNTFQSLRSAYSIYASREPSEIAVVEKYYKQSMLQQINWQVQAFEAGFGGVVDNSGSDFVLARSFITTTAEMYGRLINEQDPDGKLVEFLDMYPEFEEDIGGRPSWLG